MDSRGGRGVDGVSEKVRESVEDNRENNDKQIPKPAEEPILRQTEEDDGQEIDIGSAELMVNCCIFFRI